MTLSTNRPSSLQPHFAPLKHPISQTSRAPLSVLPTTPHPQAPEGDNRLAGLYTNVLRNNQDKPWNVELEPVGPIPSDSTLGQWRHHLTTLLQSPDFKEWAQQSRIDLSKSIVLFPPRGAIAGFAALTVKPPATARNALGIVKYFGSFVGGGSQALPLSWSIIMQASTVLASGQTSIRAPTDGMALAKDVAAFYGDPLPKTAEEANERATQLEQQKAFAGSAHEGKEDALEHQKSQMGDVSNRHTFARKVIGPVFDAFMPLYLDAQEKAGLPIGSGGSQNTALFSAPLKSALENLFDVTTLPLDPQSSYQRVQALKHPGEVTLKRFMEDHGWTIPTSLAELKSLFVSVTAASPLSPPHGDLGGALSWPVPPSHQVQVSSSQTLSMSPGAKHGLFRQLTSRLVLDTSMLAHPRRVIEGIIDSAEGQRVGKSLQDKFGGLHTESSVADWLLTALQLSLDQDTLLDRSGASTRNKVAGFDLASPAHFGKHPSQVVKALSDHLEGQQKASAELAPVAAHLLLARRAPAFLVKDVPATIAYGSHSWVGLEVAVARLEAKAPGSTALMTYAQVMANTNLAPITHHDQLVEYTAQQIALKDWGVANGVVETNAKDEYTAPQMTSIRTAFTRQIEELSAASTTFSTDMPTRRELAVEALKKAYGDDIDYEKPCIESLTKAQDRDDVGPHSIVDIYLNGGYGAALGRDWTSTDPSVAIERLKTPRDLPDINAAFDKAFPAYTSAMETAIGAQVKHLIATLPLEDRKNIEQGKLDIFKDVQVKTDNFGETTKATVPHKNAVLLKLERNGVVTLYEVNLQQKTIRKREDKNTAEPGKMIQDYRAGITTFEYPRVVPEGRYAATITDEKPTSDAIPDSYASDRTAYIAGALVKSADIGAYESEARGQTTFDSRQPFYMNSREILLNILPVYSAIKNFEAGNIGDGIIDLTLDAFGFMIGLSAAAKSAKALKVGASSAARITRAVKIVGRAAIGSLNPVDGIEKLPSIALKGARSASSSIKQLRGAAGQYDLLKASQRYDVAATGTYKLAEQTLETPAVMHAGKWYAYDSVTGKAYGAPLAMFSANSIAMGGEMQNFRIINNGLGMSEDVTKRGLRLTLDAHGGMIPNGKSALMQVDGEFLTPSELLDQLKASKVDLSKYSEIRLTMCNSGTGADESFAAQLAKMTNKPTEGFLGVMHTDSEVEDVAARMFKNGGVKQREYIDAHVNGVKKEITKYKMTGKTGDNRGIYTVSPDYNPVRFSSEGKLLPSKPVREPYTGEVIKPNGPQTPQSNPADVDFSDYEDLT
ncbi:hypothetical protein [Pseudomonas azotoformans]